MDSLTEYMKKELVFYIKQEHEKGIPISTIRKSLLGGGHHKDLVSHAISSLKKNKFNLVKSLAEPVKNNLDKDLYFNIINSLVKYIEYHIAAGKSQKEIRDILVKYGHSDKVIEAAFSKVGNEITTPNDWIRYADYFLIAGFTIMLFFVAGLTKEPLELIFMGFSPSILTLIFSNLLILRKMDFHKIFYFPVTFLLIFGVLYFIPDFPVSGMDVFKLSIFNLLFSIGYVGIKAGRMHDLERDIEVIVQDVGETVEESYDEPKSKQKKQSKK